MIDISNATFGEIWHSRQVFASQTSTTCPGHTYNPAAIDFDDLNVDIFRDNDIIAKTRAIQNAKESYAKIHQRIEVKNRSSTDFWRNDRNLPVLDYTASNCAWLTLDRFSRAGIGHTYRAWDLHLQTAIRENLTYYAPFYTPFHGLCDLNETANYFGFHSHFYWARSPPAKARVVNIGDPINGGCRVSWIADNVDKYKRKFGPFSCSKGHVVFYCYNDNSKQTFSTSFKDSIEVSREIFQSTYQLQREKYLIASIESARAACNIIVVVHIRRGDVLKAKYPEKKRLISFAFYKSLLNTVLKIRKAQNEYLEVPVSIFLLSEDSPTNGKQIIEYDQRNARKIYHLDVTKALEDTCSNYTKCSIQVLPSSTSVLSSFTAMCDSDILVSGDYFSLFSVLFISFIIYYYCH